MTENKKDACERAEEILNMENPPKLALAYAKKLTEKSGYCAEALLTAFAQYAQIEEGLPCEDDLYLASDERRELFASVKASLTD